MSAPRPWPEQAPPPPASSFSALLEALRMQAPTAPALSWRDPADAGSVWQTLDRAALADQVTGCATWLAQPATASKPVTAWPGWG